MVYVPVSKVFLIPGIRVSCVEDLKYVCFVESFPGEGLYRTLAKRTHYRHATISANLMQANVTLQKKQRPMHRRVKRELLRTVPRKDRSLHPHFH